MPEMKTHKDLKIWQRGVALVTDIYKLTDKYPRHEIFGIISQMRRAATSIPLNIAEGCARRSAREYAQFLHIAVGSIAELDTQLIISRNLGFINDVDLNKYVCELIELRKMTTTLIRNLENPHHETEQNPHP